MTGATTQLWALLRLRWELLRSAALRVGLVATFLFLGWLGRLAVSSGEVLDDATVNTAIRLAPAAFLGFGVLAVISPLTSGGGNEIVPPDQLVAYPVRPRTQFLGGLVLTPLNLVWVVQLLGLTAMTSCLTLSTSLPLGALTSAAFVGCLTVLGQAVAWLVVGLRQTRTGRRAVGTAGAFLLLGVVFTVHGGQSAVGHGASPIRNIVEAVRNAGSSKWAITTGVLLGMVVIGLLVGSRLCAWALRRPGDAGSSRHLKALRRRGPRRSTLRELVAVDRASVWRAPALRRGGLVLAVLPGLVAAGAAVPWESLIVLPGLVAAGAGLLFGVNAFCLDGSGAMWVASLPHEPRLIARAKTVVLTETVLGAVLVAALAGSSRSPGTPTGAEVAGIIAVGLTCTSVVVAQGMHASVQRPHRADLRGPRDAVAPPGAMALASLRLAAPTALVALIIAAAAATGVWWLPLGLGLTMIVAAGMSLARTLRRYEDPVRRARVVAVVSAG